MEKGIYFKIDRVKSKTGSETFSAKQKLERNGSGNDRLSERDRGTELFGGGIENEKDVKQFDKPKLSQLNQDFFQDANDTNNKKAARKKSKPCSNTKFKARNFLTNISYRRYKWTDF